MGLGGLTQSSKPSLSLFFLGGGGEGLPQKVSKKGFSNQILMIRVINSNPPAYAEFCSWK